MSSEQSEQNTWSVSHARWCRPIIEALRVLGGCSTPIKVREEIRNAENVPDGWFNETRKSGSPKFNDEVNLARLALVKADYISGSKHGVWELTHTGREKNLDQVDRTHWEELVRKIYPYRKKERDSLGDNDAPSKSYWLYEPGKDGCEWENFHERGIMGLNWKELGDLSEYAEKQEIVDRLNMLNDTDASYKNRANAIWRFVHEVQPGDVIFAGDGKGEIYGQGVVETEYEFLASGDEYPNIHKVRWTELNEEIEDKSYAVNTLKEITNKTNLVNRLKELFTPVDADEDINDERPDNITSYKKADFLREAYMDEETYDKLTDVLAEKMNLVLQGAPGVGKTFLAKRLAYSIMGVKDSERVKMVQFHQNYSYEDFIEGFRPNDEGDGFVLRPGPFREFCEKASEDSDNAYFFIIDEINRGNVSKIFGELFMLIESDKRGKQNRLQTLYSNDGFFVPENVFMIGMMNTADRGLALLDYALRRRFAFFTLNPGFKSARFEEYKKGLKSDQFNNLIDCVCRLNEAIRTDEALGAGFCIGHSYFCGLEPEGVTSNRLSNIVEFEIMPQLEEYWFDEPEKVQNWRKDLQDALK